MDRQPHREQAVIAERVERDVRRINLNAVFGLVLVMWALGIIYQFLGLLPEVVNLVVPFLPLGLSLHSFNHALFPGQEAPVSTPFCQWIPILSLIVFINNAITLPSRNKLHVLVCVVTMTLALHKLSWRIYRHICLSGLPKRCTSSSLRFISKSGTNLCYRSTWRGR